MLKTWWIYFLILVLWEILEPTDIIFKNKIKSLRDNLWSQLLFFFYTIRTFAFGYDVKCFGLVIDCKLQQYLLEPKIFLLIIMEILSFDHLRYIAKPLLMIMKSISLNPSSPNKVCFCIDKYSCFVEILFWVTEGGSNQGDD